MVHEFYVGGLRLIHDEPEAKGASASSVCNVAQGPKLEKTSTYFEYSDPTEPSEPRYLEKVDRPLISEPLDHLVNDLRLSLEDKGGPTSRSRPVFRYCKERGFFQLCDPPAFRPNPRTMAVFIDGACRANGRNSAKASWGHYFGPGSPSNAYGCLPSELPQTSSRAEIEALLEVLKRFKTANASMLKSIDHVWILTDSAYVADSVNDWLPRWIRADGHRADGKPVAHYSDWIQVYDLIKKLETDGHIKVHVRHVRREDNEGADAMANLALDTIPVAYQHCFTVNVAYDKKAGLYRLHYSDPWYGTINVNPNRPEESIIAVFIAGASRGSVGSVVEFYFGPGSRYNRGAAVSDGSRSLISELWAYEEALRAADGILGVDEVIVLTDCDKLFSRVFQATSKMDGVLYERFYRTRPQDISERPSISMSFVRTAKGRGLRLIPRDSNKVAQQYADEALEALANDDLEFV